jgi:hypothetical protein
MKRIFVALICMSAAISMTAQTSLDLSDFAVPSKIAPGYFGPNAFPVPEMSDGSTSAQWKVEIYSDHFFGTMGESGEDYTTDIFARLTIPLFSPRANLVVWGPLHEFFHTGPSVNSIRRLPFEGDVDYHTPGDIYVSTEFQTLVQDRHGLDMTIRTVLKSASGDRYEYARYYDSPGYFFDATFGRGFELSENVRTRIALSSGFLCWQTDNGRQNDAVMYGVLASLDAGAAFLKVQYGGYVGWERDGDCPMTLRADLGCNIGAFSVKAGLQKGFKDWPFNHFRIGVEYRFSKF